MESRVDAASLLGELEWVRELARGLVRDASLADDLAQEAWLSASRRSKSSPAALGAQSPRRWLAAIVHNLARERGRREATRRQHESRAADGDPRASGMELAAGEALERASVQRRLVELVLALDEPYRSAILLRYFDGLSPGEIARRGELSVATVKTRLRRGLEMLRTSLARAGDERSWLQALLPLIAGTPERAGTGWLSAGGVAMSAKIAASVVAASAVALGGWLVLSERELAPNTSAASPRAEEPVAVAAAEPAVLAQLEDARERSAIDSRPSVERAAADPAAAAEAPLASSIAVETIDPAGFPVAGVALQRVEGAERELLGRTDASGRLEAGLDDRNGRISAAGDAWVTVLDALLFGAANAEFENEHVVVVAPACELAGEIVDEEGTPVGDADVRLEFDGDLRHRLARRMDGSAYGHWSTRTSALGSFELALAPCAEWTHLVVRHPLFLSQWVDLDGAPRAGMRVVLERPGPDSGVLLGRVLDPLGAPVQDAWVTVGTLSARTDRSGDFQLDTDWDGPLAADAVLRALAPGFLPARLERDVSAHPRTGWPEQCELVLREDPLTLSGRVVDGDGSAIEGAEVQVADPELFGWVEEGSQPAAFFHTAHVEELVGGERARARTDSQGRFELGGLQRRTYRLWVVSPALAHVLTDPIAAGEDDVSIELANEEAVRVRGRVVRSDGSPLAGLNVVPLRTLDASELEPASTNLLEVFADSAESGPDGRFAFDSVDPRGATLQVFGGPAFDVVFRSLDGYDGGELVIEIAGRCHLKVELASGLVASEFRVYDGAGEPLHLARSEGDVTFSSDQGFLTQGQSLVYLVPEMGRELALFADGEEVLRVPLALELGRINVVRL